MPFVRRIIAAEAESTFSKYDREHELHVPARKVEKGDVVIPPEQIHPDILRDLARRFPKEYGKAALERGLVTLEDEDDEELEQQIGQALDDDEDEETFTPEQEAFMVAKADVACAMVKAAAEDPELLALYAEAEAAKEKPRKSVLEALNAALSS